MESNCFNWIQFGTSHLLKFPIHSSTLTSVSFRPAHLIYKFCSLLRVWENLEEIIYNFSTKLKFNQVIVKRQKSFFLFVKGAVSLHLIGTSLAINMLYKTNGNKSFSQQNSFEIVFWVVKNVVAFKSSTKFRFSTSYDLTATLPWQCPFNIKYPIKEVCSFFI